jgi:4-hydroxy-2-oxoheptanedioate aldolase
MPLNGFPNNLKTNLAHGKVQIGIWSSLCSPIVAELMAGAGFDWLLVDSEHTPSDLDQIMAQLQATAPYPTETVVRLPAADPTLIKRYMDTGVRSLLIPFVEDATTTRMVVAATRYPPKGFRGVSVAHRGNRFGRVKDYLKEADETNCVVVQLETRKSLAAVEEIALVEGIDAVFIGPSDLAADFGQLGNAGHPDVQAAIRETVDRCKAINRPIGILAPAAEDARRYLEWGATLVAVGSDIGVLVRGTDQLVQAFVPDPVVV